MPTVGHFLTALRLREKDNIKKYILSGSGTVPVRRVLAAVTVIIRVFIYNKKTMAFHRSRTTSTFWNTTTTAAPLCVCRWSLRRKKAYTAKATKTVSAPRTYIEQSNTTAATLSIKIPSTTTMMSPFRLLYLSIVILVIDRLTAPQYCNCIIAILKLTEKTRVVGSLTRHDFQIIGDPVRLGFAKNNVYNRYYWYYYYANRRSACMLMWSSTKLLMKK